MANEFLESRIVVGNFTVLSSDATQAIGAGVFLPAGAIVTGVTMHDKNALGSVHSNDSASIDLRIRNVNLASSIMLCSTKRVKDFPTVNIPVEFPLTSTAGVYLPVGGELVLSVQASSGTGPRTWSPQAYVGYVV